MSSASFKRPFNRAERFIVNTDFPSEWAFMNSDGSNRTQAEDMRTVDAVMGQNGRDRHLRIQVTVSIDLGSRLLAKLGLAVGYKLLGSVFFDTDYAKNPVRLSRVVVKSS